MSQSITEIAEKARADSERIARQAKADVDRIAQDVHAQVEEMARIARAKVDRMLQDISTKRASEALQTAQFKSEFGFNAGGDIGTANTVLQVAQAREARAALDKNLPDGALKDVVGGVLAQREASATKSLERTAQTRSLSEKGGFLSAAEAANDFVTVDRATLSPLIEEANKIVAGMPPDAQAWMLSLSKTVRNQMLHQMINDDSTQSLQRIRLGFQAEPPPAWPAASADGDCLQLLRYAARNRSEDVRQTADRSLQPRLDALCRRLEADRNMLGHMRSKAAADTSTPARAQLVEISKHIETFLQGMFAEAAEVFGLSDYSLLAVGSLARGEVFPYSDLDYSVLACKEAEDKLSEIEDYMNWQLKLLEEPPLDNIGRGDPTEVAERHIATDMDVLLDARVIAKVGAGSEDLAEEYFAEIARHVDNANARKVAMINVMATEKEKFSPTGEYLNKAAKDVKKGLLRLPSFTVRNLITFHGLADAPKDIEGRCKVLMQGNFVGAKFVKDVMQVVDFAARLRLKLHAHYKTEEDHFYLPGEAPPDPPSGPAPYVLTTQEVGEYNAAVAINTDIYDRVGRLTSASLLQWNDLVAGVEVPEEREDGAYKWTIDNVAALSGKSITVKEYWGGKNLLGRFVYIDGVEYTVGANDGSVRATRGKTLLMATNATNPFL